MSGIAGRNFRLKYDADGAGAVAAVVIAHAKSDSFEVANGSIDGTTKDDAGKMSLLNDNGMQGCKMSCSGLLNGVAQHKTLAGLAMNAGSGTSVFFFEFDVPLFGVMRGQWFIDSFKIAGEDGPAAGTFEMSLSSSGTITWTPAV